VKSRPARIAAGFVAAITALFTLGSCNENAIIRSSVTPAVDNITTFGIGPDYGNDSVTMYVRTVFQDSINTSLRTAGYPVYHGLGWITDPFAGTASAGIYMQVVPTITGFKLGATEILDSLVLVLPYAGFTWGDTASTNNTTVRAYAINGTFSKDSNFYNYNRLSTAATQLGAATIVTGRTGTGVIQDSTTIRQVVGGVTQNVKKQSHLRIRIQDTSAFAPAFRTALANDSSYASFTSLLPGFFIVPDTNGPGMAIPYFRLNGSANLYDVGALVAYTHVPERTDSAIANQFVYNLDQAAHFNRITRNYSGTPANSLIGNPDMVQQTVLMQNGPGASVDVVIPYARFLPKNVLIVKAELKLTQVPAIGETQFFGPNRLYPEGVNSAGARYTIADRYAYSQGGTQYDASGFLDGNVTMAMINGMQVREYRINFPRELQRAILQGSDNLHLRITGTANYPAAYRILLGGKGQSNPAFKPALNIIYSKQNK
jgi:hypothetical protein